MKEKLSKKIKRTVTEELDYPPESLEELPVLHVLSDELAVAEGCRGILSYSTEKMMLDMGENTVTIYGKELEITELTAFSVAVKGEVFSIALDKRRTEK